MPNIKSAAKRQRQDILRRERNRAAKRELRTLCKRVRDAVSEGDVAKAEEEFRTAVKKLDRAGARKIIHPNSAARTKSRLSARVKSIKAKKA